MSTEAQNLMIEVIDAHTYDGADMGYLGEHRVEYCICGWSEEGDGVHTAHVAFEVDKALGGLTLRWGVVIEHLPRPDDGYPGAVVELDSYKLREAAEITKRDQWPDDCYEVRSRWVSRWSEA